ncbi:MAG: hypothetical protein ACT4O9_13665, partial [Blastocatellia bacterium]
MPIRLPEHYAEEYAARNGASCYFSVFGVFLRIPWFCLKGEPRKTQNKNVLTGFSCSKLGMHKTCPTLIMKIELGPDFAPSKIVCVGR